jgi:hypothetical protein
VGVAVNSSQTNQKSQNTLPYVAIAFLLGLFGSFAVSFILEKMHGFATSSGQMKKLFKNQILEEFYGEKDLENNAAILKKKAGLLNLNPKEKLQIIFINTNYKNLSSKVKKALETKKYDELRFPENAEKISATSSTILFAQVGKSKIKDLKRVRSLISAERGVVILN